MNLLLTLAFVIGIATYFATYKLSLRWRVISATAVFVMLGVVPLILILIVGDQVPPDARLVTQEELNRAAKSAP